MIDASRVKTLSSWLAITAMVVVAVIAALYMHEPASSEARFQKEATRLVEICQDAPYRPACYDKEIPTLMDQGFSMEEAFDVTRIVQDLDPSYQYCHVLGHALSAKETAKDPDNWKSVIARAPVGVCSNGAIHGAFQERFRVESFEGRSVGEIVPELSDICVAREDWSPTGMTEATCVHGLGHLTMYVTAGDVEASLALCDRIVEENESNSKRQLCYDGVFMQIYQPLEPEDEALIAGQEVETKEELTAFCGRFSGAAYGSCVTEGWPLYLDMIDNPVTAVDFCDRLNEDWQHERCLSGLFFRAMAGANLSSDWALSYCPQVRAPYAEDCFANAAARMIETDDRNIEKALALCDAAAETGHERGCYDKMLQYSSYNFTLGSPEFYAVCNGLPERWRIACLNQIPRTGYDSGT